MGWYNVIYPESALVSYTLYTMWGSGGTHLTGQWPPTGSEPLLPSGSVYRSDGFLSIDSSRTIISYRCSLGKPIVS